MNAHKRSSRTKAIPHEPKAPINGSRMRFSSPEAQMVFLLKVVEFWTNPDHAHTRVPSEMR
jgi:hypothetical protein